MEMKVRILLIILLFLSACTVKTEILIGDEEIITIHSKADALVTVVSNERTITVNNQGKPTLFESIITMMFMDNQIKDNIKED